MFFIYVSLLKRPEDETAFLMLYDRYLTLLGKEASKYFPNGSGLHEDAMQHAWAAIAKSFVKIAALPEEDVARYLVAIVKNKCKDVLRKERKHSTQWFLEDLATDDNVESIVFGREEYHRVMGKIAMMKDPFREVLERRFFLGESNGEIAKRMGVHKVTASKWYTTARTKLIAALQGDEAYHA